MKEDKNIIIISIDDLRYDAISLCSEVNRVITKKFPEIKINIDTPNIDKLGKMGVYFTQCYSTSSYTPPAHASMLTGTYINRHCVRTFFGKLSNNVKTIAEILKRKGYKTLASVENLTLELLDITRGFDVVDDLQNDEYKTYKYIENWNGEKCLFFLHLFDVHKPYCYLVGKPWSKYNSDYLDTIYKICEKYEINFEILYERSINEAKRIVKNFHRLSESLKEYCIMRSLDFLLREKLREKNKLFDEIVPLYFEGVNKFDSTKFKDIIKILKSSGLLDTSIIVITSDHGEIKCSWNGREDFMNSFFLYEDAIRVPLIIYSEELPKGKVITTPVSIIDIVPTLLNMLGIKYNIESFDGISLTRLIFGENRKRYEERCIFFETWAYRGGVDQFGNIRSIDMFRREIGCRYKRYKYIRIGTDIDREKINKCSETEFIKLIFRKILGKFENNDDLILLKKKMEYMSREELIDMFSKKIEQERIYEIQKDINEQRNLLNYDNNIEFVLNNFRKEIYSYLVNDNCSKKIILDDEINEIKERLTILGYL